LKFNIRRFNGLHGILPFAEDDHNFPSHAYPPTEDTPIASVNLMGQSVAPGSITVTLNISWEADNWFFPFFRMSAERPFPVAANIVHLKHIHAVGFHDVTISGLPSGPLTLKWCRVSKTGKASRWYSTITDTIP